MPTYVYNCTKCRKTKEVFHSMSEVDKPSQETLSEITCKHGVMKRVPQEVQLAGASGGQFKTEKELLTVKQQQRKTRSRAHFKNEILPTIGDPGERRHFEKKFKGTKKIDHEKIK